MDFAELIYAKNAAITADDEASAAVQAAAKALEEAEQVREESAAARTAANLAIHDLLAEKGEHYLVDPGDGTLTVYKVSDEEPGYLAVHPIPGTKKAAK